MNMAKRFMLTILFLNMDMTAHAVKPEILTIAYEASGESLAGQIAVASVIKTRMGDRGLSASDVVYQPHQFSCWSKPLRILSETEVKIAKVAWDLSSPGEYNHFMSSGLISARYKYKVIGKHLFYKLGGK